MEKSRLKNDKKTGETDDGNNGKLDSESECTE